MYETAYHPDSIADKHFLVTGGAGFIGSNLVEYLLKHQAGKVVVLDNLATGFKENLHPFMDLPNFRFIEGDIRRAEDCQEACKDIHYVFHQAALGSVPRSIENPLATHEVNATGFIQLLIAARDAKVKRVVYASSSSVYGDSPLLPKKEDHIGKQLSPYAVSKLTNELYGEIFAKTYQMEVIGLRYFNIFGPRQNPSGAYAAAIPLFIHALLKNEAPKINGDGSQTRDFTFVANAVQANIKAMFSNNTPTVGEVFNIAVGERISLNQLMESLRQLTGKNIQQEYRAERKGDVKDSLADISKAKHMLNYQPQFQLEEGLIATLNWFEQYLKS